MSAPDDELRARLRALAEHEPLPALSASERVLAERAAEAAVRLREPTSGRWLSLAFAGSIVLAGAVFWLVSADAPPLAQRPPAAPVVAARAPEVVRTPCQAFSQRALSRTSVLELRGRAAFSAAEASAVSVSLSAQCDLTAELHAGHVFVHAQNLAGRSLRVLTPHGEVEVRGTVFAVHAEADSFAVEVDEGRVQVRARDGRSVSLTAGETVRVTELRALQKKPLPLVARNLVRVALGLTPRSLRPAEARQDAGAVEQTSEAPVESIWQLGSVPTPSQAPEPKTSVTNDGRPMQKPRIKPGD